MLVAHEHLWRRFGGPGDVAQRQVEPRRPAGHVLHHPVQAGQPPDDLVTVTGPVGFGQPLQIPQDVGEHQPGKVYVMHPGSEHTFDRRVRAVPQLAELVDRLPVPVAGQAARPRGVLQPVQHPVVGEVVQPAPPADHVARHAVMRGGEFGQHLRDVVGMRLGHVGTAQPVHGPQDPQVRDIVVAPGEAERAEPVADRQRVEVERVSLVIEYRHRDEPLPVREVAGACTPMMAPCRATGCDMPPYPSRCQPVERRPPAGSPGGTTVGAGPTASVVSSAEREAGRAAVS